MTMYDLCRQVNCKHITCGGGGKSATAWLECKLHNKCTDENHCAKCKDRVPKKGVTQNDL